MKLHLKKDSCLQTDAFAAGKYLTITGFRHYYGLQPFRIGSLIRCRKEPDNAYDDEAICCTLPTVGTVGYVANSPQTTAGGTMSAGRLYDRVPRRFYVRVCFTTFTKVICQIVPGSLETLNAELTAQLHDCDDWE